jgi:predicted RecA/RadA family phage recombinase
MATNYVQPGDVLTLTAPYQRNTGQGALVGSIFGVALQTVANAVAGEFATKGVWSLSKTSAQAWTVGQKIYWDNSNKRCDSDSTVGQLIGVATAVADNPSSTGYVRLNGAAPATAEGAQAAIADLTDSSGGATADGTIGAVTAPTALTHSVGTADNTVDDVTGSFSQTVLNNNFKELTTAQAANRLAIIALTDAVKELSTKVNAILADLRAAGIVAP